MTDDGVPAFDELLSLLGNETRMAAVRALYDRFDFEAYVTESRDGASYSALFEAADTDDSGNFNYHLRRLDGTLVDAREDGYVLTPLGYNLMRSIDRYDAFEYDTREPWVLDDPCPYCGGDLAAEYSRELLGVRCRDCEGIGSGGNFTFVEVPATGGGRLGDDELLDAATLALFDRVRSSGHGVCWDCRAAMDRSIERCGDHRRGPGGVCGECDHRYRTKVHADCPNCGNSGRGPVLEYAIVSPTVGAFFERTDDGPTGAGPWRYRLAALGAATESAAADAPQVVEFAFDHAGDTFRVCVENRPDGVVVEPAG